MRLTGTGKLAVSLGALVTLIAVTVIAVTSRPLAPRPATPPPPIPAAIAETVVVEAPAEDATEPIAAEIVADPAPAQDAVKPPAPPDEEAVAPPPRPMPRVTRPMATRLPSADGTSRPHTSAPSAPVPDPDEETNRTVKERAVIDDARRTLEPLRWAALMRMARAKGPVSPEREWAAYEALKRKVETLERDQRDRTVKERAATDDASRRLEALKLREQDRAVRDRGRLTGR